MLAHLSIGPAERTERVNLIDPSGFCLDEAGWIPQAGDHATNWRESALADYRQPASYKDLTTIETLNVLLKHGDQDLVIRKTQDLRRVLRRALDYWISRTSDDVVYIEARASCETNTRYAVVYEGRLPHDDYPYREPFTAGGMANLMLVVERGPWLDATPGTGTVILAQGAEDWCFPNYLEFDAIDDNVDCGNDAKLNELPGFLVFGKGIITAEAWIRAMGWGEGGVNGSRIFDKTDWGLAIQPTNGLIGFVDYTGNQGRTYSGEDDFTVDGEWRHVLMEYSEVGGGGAAARHVYLAVDGVWVSEFAFQDSTLNYLGDAGDDLFIGDLLASNRCFDGDIGWCRVSNSLRHNPTGAPFTPPARCTLPDIDANTMGQWIKEGDGAAVYNQSGGTPGSITGYPNGAQWDCDCPETFGYVPPPGGVPSLGWWDPADEGLCVWGAWQAKNAGNFAGSLVDLTGNGNDLVDPGGANTPGWSDAAGWSFDGINDYLTTTFIPQNDQSQSMLCQFTGWVDTAGNDYLAGTYTVGNGYFTMAPNNGTLVFGGNGVQRWYFGAAFNNGNLGIAGNKTYKNGTDLVFTIGNYTVVPTFPVFVGAFNNAGAAAGFGTCNMQAFVLYDCTLTSAQMDRVYQAMFVL